MDLQLKDKCCTCHRLQPRAGLCNRPAPGTEKAAGWRSTAVTRRMPRAAAKVIAGETGARVIGLAGDVADPDVPERLVGETAGLLAGSIFSLPTRAARLPGHSSRSTKLPGRRRLTCR